MAKIRYIEDKDGEIVLPVTHERGVIDSQGKNLETKLEGLIIERDYDQDNPNGKGYIVLKKNRSFASQLTSSNTIYEIRYDYDLNNSPIFIPENCVLNFTGGSVSNGSLSLNNTTIIGEANIGCTLLGTIQNRMIYSSWFDSIQQSVTNAKNLNSGLYVDTAATLTSPISFFGLRELEIRATITNSEQNYIEIGYDSSIGLPVKIDIWKVSYVKLTGGKEMIVTLRDCDNFVIYADDSIASKNSIAYNTFNLGRIGRFSIIGNGNGWVNENTFIKGRFISSFSIIGDGYYHNNNVFYNPTFEGNLLITLNKCSYNTFRDVRLEGDVTFSYDDFATNNKFYRSWFTNSFSLMRKYYGPASKNKNGIYYEDSSLTKCFTINKQSFVGHRDLSKVSLCDDNDRVRFETSGTYCSVEVNPQTNFGVVLISDSVNLSRTRVTFYDSTGANISDTLTSDIGSIGSFSKVSTDPNNIYYKLDTDRQYNYYEINVDHINYYLKSTYGVDGSQNPNKQLGKVVFAFSPNNVRRLFDYVDLRVLFPSNGPDNPSVTFKLPFALPENTSPSKPTIKSTISGTAIPYSILDGEKCLVTANNVLYKRIGSDVLFECGIGASGTTRPSLSQDDIGYQFFDTTLGGVVIWNGTSWVDTSTNPALCELKENKVTSLSSSSTHIQYPSAKAVFDEIMELSETIALLQGEIAELRREAQ